MLVEQIGGAALMLLFLADIFLTVLYARAGTGLLAPRWNRLVWATGKTVSRLFGSRRGLALSFAGPVIVVLLVAFWALGLTIGAALIIQPELGSTIRPSNGDTPRDFVTALMVAGNSLSIVGSGDYTPHTTGTRLLFLLNSLIGASVLSLVLSYLVQVYSGLRERNALALTIDLMSDGTGDAAEMLARLMHGGKAADATSELGNLVRSLVATKEAHHFYPLLFYFRFVDPRFSVSRFTFVLLDLITLIDSALDQRKHGAPSASVPVTAIRQGALLLLKTLDRNFPTASDKANENLARWKYRQSYDLATAKLAHFGITTQPAGIERYVALRREWEPLVRRVARTLGDTMDDIDRRAPAATQTEAASTGSPND